jgi:hypothetical protein
VAKTVAAAAAAGIAVGVAVTWHNRAKKADAKASHEAVKVEDLHK